MPIANLHFYRLFILVFCQLYICKLNPLIYYRGLLISWVAKLPEYIFGGSAYQRRRTLKPMISVDLCGRSHCHIVSGIFVFKIEVRKRVHE